MLRGGGGLNELFFFKNQHVRERVKDMKNALCQLLVID
jgi:hypothetical protein